jgi:type I restriction enzyme, S subunit
MSFPRYPKYKDSGVEWLGEVPEHWETCAVKRIVRMQSGESITAETIEEAGEYPVFGGNGLRGYTSGFTHEGDFVLIGRQGALCGNINYADGRFWASEHAVVASPVAPVATRWLGEMLRAMNLNQYSVSAAQPGLSVDLVGNLRTVRPPLSEQSCIASFLDRETAKIDELVAEQRRLLELLKEKRQAVIAHAVTRGLDPLAPLKPSGIEWLGEVPEHWDALSLRRCSSRVHTGGTPSTESPGTELEEGVVWFTPGDFGDSLRLTTSSRRISVAAVESGEVKVFPPRSVLVVSIGATLGKVGFAEEQSSANQQINAVVPNERISGYFLAYSLSGKAEVMRFLSNASTIGIMNQEKTKDIWVAVPPREEQEEITGFLDVEISKLDTLTAEAQRAIDLLQERRTALISAAVTGQIDVRGLAAPTA